MDNKPQDVSFFGHPRGLATLFSRKCGKDSVTMECAPSFCSTCTTRLQKADLDLTRPRLRQSCRFTDRSFIFQALLEVFERPCLGKQKNGLYWRSFDHVWPYCFSNAFWQSCAVCFDRIDRYRYGAAQAKRFRNGRRPIQRYRSETRCRLQYFCLRH